ncbi:MAG TPA: RHS repeat-associated core domain-containing protein [Bryobacteraceae bacterium]|nr:RHS repeat-associated core domain-containing protein [Bryobacteraceae bacterium]
MSSKRIVLLSRVIASACFLVAHNSDGQVPAASTCPAASVATTTAVGSRYHIIVRNLPAGHVSTLSVWISLPAAQFSSSCESVWNHYLGTATVNPFSPGYAGRTELDNDVAWTNVKWQHFGNYCGHSSGGFFNDISGVVGAQLEVNGLMYYRYDLPTPVDVAAGDILMAGVSEWTNYFGTPASLLGDTATDPNVSYSCVDSNSCNNNGVQTPYIFLTYADGTVVGHQLPGCGPISAFGTSGTPTNPTASVSEPINTATGSYYMSPTDFSVPGKGLAFTFTRAYNSLDSYTGPLGPGWTHSYNIFLTVDPSTLVVSVKEADGHQDSFAPTGGGAYVAATTGLFDSLILNGDGSFTLTRKNQTKLTFSSSGRLTGILDRNGNTQVLTYNGSGLLVSILDSASRSFAFAYDASGRITSITDPTARAWRYSYDANGNLVSVRDPLNNITQYTYDSRHRMLTAIDSRGITYLQNLYDAQGRVLTQANGRGYVTSLAYNTPAAGTTTITDPLGNATQHVYDVGMRLIQMKDANGGVVSYTYDLNNNRTSRTDQNGNTTTTSYDGHGNATGIGDPLGNARAFAYDSKNNLLTSTNPKGATTTFSYDVYGNLTSLRDPAANTTTFTYGPAGLLASKTDARGNVTSYSYDSAGNLTRVSDALNHATSFTYDAIGRLLTTTDPNGHTASTAYDSLNRITGTTDPLGHATQFTYDAVGNLLKVTDANGNRTSYGYDATNNLVTVTDAAGGVTQYGYDPNNNRVSFTNAKGNATTYSYDALNRLTKSTDPLSFATSYTYDGAGNTTSTTDANGKTNQYTYDADNRLTNGSFADGSSVTYTYDADGNRASMTDWRGTTTYTYDSLDRMLSVSSPGGNLVHYGYDATGNRASLGYPDGRSAQYQYDPLNRISKVIDWTGKTTQYTYDPGGNLAGFALPNGASSAYTYDAANRLLQIMNRSASQVLSSFAYTLDSVGNRSQVTSAASGTTKYGYDALYRLTSWAAPSGQITQYTYDPVGNRLSMVSSAGTTAYSYDAADRILAAGATTYGYDHNGNQTTKTTGTTTVTFAYDPLNRLISATGGGVSSQYRYDGDGNRVSQIVPAGTYQYVNDTATSLAVALGETGPDGSIDYLYGSGLISETSPAFQYFYQFDGLGSTANLTDATGALKATYAYDPWGKLNTPIDPLGTKNKYKFTGESLDSNTGLYYLRARFYDPSVGRFIKQDPTPGSPSNPATLNRFVYALNAPMLRRDPSGLSSVDTDTSGRGGGPPNPETYLTETAQELGQQIGQDLLRPALLQFGVAPTVAGTVSAFANLAGPGLSVYNSVQDAISHPQRSLLEDLQRGSIDLAANSVLTLASVMGGPTAPVFFLSSVYYNANREQIETNILNNYGGWITTLVSPATAR